ncbi:MAG: phage portal protein [Chloroflexi bacterium]|nr:phage portal protein [Chloroflexota bacterium]
MNWVNLRETIANRLFGDIIQSRVHEAITLAEEDKRWRHLYGTSRDVSLTELLENINDSAEAYRVNPLAYRIIELTTDYVLGKGMRVTSQDEEIQQFINEFWSHPLNQMNTRQFDLCTELSLAGELFVTFHTNPYDKMTYVRSIPAASIDEIETNPDDIEDETRYHRKAESSAGGATGMLRSSAGRWWSKDDCHHYAINRLVGAVRGQGDLVPLLPWLRRYKDWLTDRVRINKFKGAFLWDVKLLGADRAAILRRQGELLEPPNPGSVIVHNEGEEWKAVQPLIDAQAVEPDGKAMRLMIGAGAGVPLHFLAEGESATKATAQEMSGPTLRHFERRQLYFGHVITDIVAEASRRRFGDTLRPILKAQFEDLTTEDTLLLAQASGQIAQALVTFRDQGWIDDATASTLVAKFTGGRE